MPRKFQLLIDINAMNLVKPFHIHSFLSYKESVLLQYLLGFWNLNWWDIVKLELWFFLITNYGC